MRQTAWRLVGLATTVAMLAIASPAVAQDAAEGAKGQTLWDTFLAGGTIGMCIVALNVVALALAIEYFVIFRREKLIPPEVLSELEVLFADEEYEEALELCEAEPSALTRAVSAGIHKMAAGYDRMTDATGGAIDAESFNMQTKIGYLSVINALAPMLGLLGTVQGMIMAFQQIATSSGAPEPAELASSIGLALVTTFEGLVVAIPFIAIAYGLRARATRLCGEVGGVVEELFERRRSART